MELQEGRSYCVERVAGEGEPCSDNLMIFGELPCVDGFACIQGVCTRRCPSSGLGSQVGVAAPECDSGTLCFDDPIAEGVCRTPHFPVEMGQHQLGDCISPQQLLGQGTAHYCTVACPNGDADCPGDLYCATPTRSLASSETRICVQPGQAGENVGCRTDDDCTPGFFCDPAAKQCAARTP